MKDKTELAKREESILDSNHAIPTQTPLVDIYDNEDEILLHADMPGVEKKNIRVNIDDGRLYLSGARQVEEAGTARWEEFGSVEYQRTFSVPQTIEIDKIKAELKDGVLHLHLPKSDAAKPKQIEIQSA